LQPISRASAWSLAIIRMACSAMPRRCIDS
jgi:hypothetical protein